MEVKQFFEQSKYFKPHEFDSPDEPGSWENMKTEFLCKLEYARGIAKVAFRINSGYRTPEHNRKVGGKRNSAHRKGYAADISTLDSRTRSKVLRGLILAGFNRIGIGQTFVHVDCDPSKDADVAWTYGEPSPAALKVELSWFARTWRKLFKKEKDHSYLP